MSEPTPDKPPKRKIRISISRQRVVEFTVVVMGVLVALGLENLIQEARFRADARDLERAFVGDISNAVFLSLERQGVTPCLIQRLRVLSERVDAATGELDAAEHIDATGNPGYATPQIYRSPTRTWVTASFDRALGSEAFKRIPAERAAEYAGLFAVIRGQHELNDAEYMATIGLAPLAYSQPNMNAELRAEGLRQIANLDRHQRIIALVSGQIVERSLSLSLIGEDVRRSLIEDEDVFRAYQSEMRAIYGDCIDFTAMERLLIRDAS